MNAKFDELEKSNRKLDILLDKMGGKCVNIDADFTMKTLTKQISNDSPLQQQQQQQDIISEVLSSESNNHIEIIDVDRISYESQIDRK